jgi:predicted PurR-regulated permease PerM
MFERGDVVVNKASVGAGWQRAIITLTGTVVGVVVVGTLFWAQAVFIPVALAVFLTFLLSPLVNRLRQRGLPRTPSVIVAVLMAAAVLGGIGWLVTAQITSLLRELPKYRETVREKVEAVKHATAGTGGIGEMIEEITAGGKSAPRAAAAAGAGGEAARKGEDGEAEAPAPLPELAAPTAVILEPQRAAWMSKLTSFLSPLLEYVGELALSIILVIFMLLKREELRNRVIRLAGHGKIVAATKFVDEAGHRVSRFLLMQAIVNASFGVLFGLGLMAIGVKYALLWGFLGAMLRYLPYIGPYVAVTFPLSLSVAMSHGWGSTLMVIGLFLTLELIISNFIEPRLYGQSMGVSEIALLVSAAFWAFLWGPIGLVLSSPLTVCLVVLGRYMPQLEFLSVLLGDEPALDAAISFYQRLLARDQDEAESLIIEQMKAAESPEQVYDTMLLPALGAIKRSRLAGDITEDDERYAIQVIREIVEDIGEGRIGAAVAAAADGQAEDGAPASAPASAEPPIPIYACPAHDAEDRVALEMLQRVLDPARWDLELIEPATLTAELLDLVGERGSGVICIASTPPGGLAHTRYLCKRLRSRFPDLKIVVGRWGAHDITTTDGAREAGADRAASTVKEAAADTASATVKEVVPDPVIAALKEAGADLVAATLLETRQQLACLIPVLVQGRDDRPRDNAAATGATGRAPRADRAAERGVAVGARTA